MSSEIYAETYATMSDRTHDGAMSSEIYTATYTSASDHTYNRLHDDHYTDLRWTAREANDDNITADDHYIDINNLNEGSPNSNAHSSNPQQGTSEQHPHVHHAEISYANTSTSQTNERNNQHPCHESRKFIIATVTMTILSVLVIIITIALSMTFASDGCTDPPKSKERTESNLESKGGRTFAVYLVLERKSVDTFDHCPVSVCTHGSWSPFTISTSDKECFNLDNKSQAIYNGKNTCTVTGRTCQRWDTNFPHKPNPKHVPTNYDDLHSNYCRDYGPPYENRPWCYTTDSERRWEVCYVPQCKY